MNSPTTATATHTATLNTVPGSSSAGAPPVNVAGATGQLSLPLLSAVSGDTGEGFSGVGADEADTKSDPAPALTMLVGIDQVNAVEKVITGVEAGTQSDQMWDSVEVVVTSAGSEEVEETQSDHTCSELVVVVMSAGTEEVDVVQSDQTCSELVVVVTSAGTELVDVVQSVSCQRDQQQSKDQLTGPDVVCGS
jgi:hypothetical protein